MSATMDLNQAVELLTGCRREGVNDRSVGDSEIGWWDGTRQIAEGRFSSQTEWVSFMDGSGEFSGAEARHLQFIGAPGAVLENSDPTIPR